MAGTLSFVDDQRALAAAWKQATVALPAEAKGPAPYISKDGIAIGLHDFCLPPAYADLNLLPEVREPMLELFAALGIPWHAGVGAGPSNHLLSSQVQCANALGQMVADPDRLARAFAGACKIGEVLEIEPGRYLTFEYIGEEDYFGEVPHGERTRGSGCTSVDAAFLHRSTDGVVELVLIEWKYTESYRRRTPDPRRDAVRRGRYEAALHDADGPVRANILDFVDLLDEPLYQLFRQQLFAHRLEQVGAHGAERVRVLHVLPPANLSYQRSLHRPSQHAVGATVGEVWQRLLRHTDRFTYVDPAVFADPKVSSEEYVRRFGAQS